MSSSCTLALIVRLFELTKVNLTSLVPVNTVLVSGFCSFIVDCIDELMMLNNETQNNICLSLSEFIFVQNVLSFNISALIDTIASGNQDLIRFFSIADSPTS